MSIGLNHQCAERQKAYSLNLNPKHPSPNQQEKCTLGYLKTSLFYYNFEHLCFIARNSFIFMVVNSDLKSYKKLLTGEFSSKQPLNYLILISMSPKCRRALEYSFSSGFIYSFLILVKTKLKSSNDFSNNQ